MQIYGLKERLSSSLWFIPILFALAAIVLALVMTWIDRSAGDGLRSTFPGDAASARSFLSAITSSMITFTALVFTITIVVLQLTSQQFSPRVLRNFLRDRYSQVALGVFISTFIYALTVLRVVQSAGGEQGETFIPGFAISIAFLLVLASVGVFILYINHMTQSIRISSIVARTGTSTGHLIERVHQEKKREDRPEQLPQGRPSLSVASSRAGYLTAVDLNRLVEVASQWDVVLVMEARVGDFVLQRSPLVAVYGPAGNVDEAKIKRSIDLGNERTLQQDVAFGFRQLVDVAVRALSPTLNDPTTAIECINQIHDLLRKLALRPFPSGQHFDDEGRLRLVLRQMSWHEYVELAVAETRRSARGLLQVYRRLEEMLEDLMSEAPEDRRAPLQLQLQLLEAEARAAVASKADRELAMQSDRSGLG